ncbi:MAG: hypothetical protein BJ554DRAFT_2548, partial [Olpidium bornovanus]
MHFVTYGIRRSHVRQLAFKRLGVLHSRRIIQSENTCARLQFSEVCFQVGPPKTLSKLTYEIAGFQSLPHLLHELDHPVFGGRKRHVHLHDLDLRVGFSTLDVIPGIDKLADQFPRTGAQQLRRVVVGLENARLSVDHHPRGADLLAEIRGVAGSVQEDEEPAVWQVAHRDFRLPAVKEERVRVRGELHRRKLVFDAVVDHFHRERRAQHVLGRHLPFGKSILVLQYALLRHFVRLVDRTAYDRQHRVGPLRGKPSRDEHVQPPGVYRVLFEIFGLQQLDEVLHGGTEVAPDGELLQRNDHVLPSLVPVSAVRKDVAELGIGELVKASGRAYGEVAPDVG